MIDRWTRRREAVAAEALAEEEERQVAIRAEAEAVQAEKSDEELLEELGLPDPDTLGEGDNFKQFLSEAVPARLKTRALRRLWRVNPVLANLDGLIDYGEDFTDSAMVVENLQSAYQVGKGMMAHVQELARQAEQADVQDTVDEDEILAQAGVEGAVDDLAETEIADAEPAPAAMHVADTEADEPDVADYAAARPVHRMAFTFDSKGAE